MIVRSLTETGIARFREYLEHVAAGARDEPPGDLLTDVQASTQLAVRADIDPARAFKGKLDFGKYLHEQLEAVLRLPDTSKDVGLWSWLDLFFFDLTCPVRPDGSRRPGAEHRHIFSRDYNRQYRHLVRTPCLVYGLHREHSVVVLRGDIDVHGEASEQVLSREHVFTNQALFEAMHKLYVTPDGAGGQKLKRGAAGKGGGTMRRIGKILKQFDLTYDLQLMSRAEIFELLPHEFERFKKTAAA